MKTLPLGKVAASAAVINDGKLLVLQRSNNSKLYAGYWTFPSGGIEETDRNVKAALMREVKEETGLKFKCKKEFGFYESHAGGKRHFALVHIGEAQGKIKMQESEVKNCKWINYSESKKLKLAFAYRKVIKDLYDNQIIK